MLTPENRALLLEQRELIKQVLPTERQAEIISYAQTVRTFTSNCIADEFGISLQNATQKLRRLHENQWLTRIAVGSPSGGSMYMYSFNKN